jgi:hypothetical protein
VREHQVDNQAVNDEAVGSGCARSALPFMIVEKLARQPWGTWRPFHPDRLYM